MIDLTKFCAEEYDPRNWMRQPFRNDFCLHATNGHVLVVLDPLPDSASDFEYLPDVVRFRLSDFVAKAKLASKSDGPWVRADSFVIHDHDWVICEECKGCGRAELCACAQCKAECWVTGSNGKKYTCAACGGDGVILQPGMGHTCDGCGGAGRYIDSRTESDHGGEKTCIALRYIALIATLPGAQLAPIDNAGTPFRFDGGYGLVMPMARAGFSKEEALK